MLSLLWFLKFSELVMMICKVYYNSLYKLCLNYKTVNGELALQLADDSKNVALKSICIFYLYS